MQKIIVVTVIILFFTMNTYAGYNPTRYNIENFDGSVDQWDQAGVTDGAWWDHGHPDIYDMRLSSKIFYSAPYSFEVEYKKRPYDPTDEFFQVDLTQDAANHADWVNVTTGENGLMRIMLRSDQANTEVQFQLATGPVIDYWSKWSDTYKLIQANTWYAIEVDWNN
jgi:hypothetical protein